MFWWKRRRRLSAQERLGRLCKVLDQVQVNEPLGFPLDFGGRIAILDSAFRAEHPDTDCLTRYAPEAIVSPLDVALTLADQKQRGLLELPSLAVAIVVTTMFEDSPLADHHRDLLWQAFGVPVFEQLLGADGKVLARECEVHDGLHVVQPAVTPYLEGDELLLTGLHGRGEHLMSVRTGVTAEIVKEHCECGSEAPRLRHLAPLKQHAVAASR